MMTHNESGSKTVAPLTNVGMFLRLLERAMDRDPRLPGMVCFHGPSGWGKSTSASYAYQKLGAYYIECRSTMTKKTFLAELLKEMGVMPERTIGAMYAQAVSELQASGRPLIIDEMDYLVQKSAVDIVRDLHDETGAAIALIGEEKLPRKLQRWERFHGRILDWQGAQPITLADCQHLARLYCPGIQLDDDLMQRLHKLARGSARRVCVNLSHIAEECRRQGLDDMSLADWGERPLYTGEAPKGRGF
ncbi:AAA family ATPase [Pseudomonas sp.]|uniref:AAA family ATPase n=1 Tax=Pseudomonas sp. TaxID=306 RepID=UPI003D116EEA